MRFFAIAVSLGLAGLVSNQALAADEMALTYNGDAAAWPATSAPISTQLCVTLLQKPAAADTASVGLVVKGPNNVWTAVASDEPWLKAKWSEADSHKCFEASLPGKAYTVALLVPNAAPKLLSTNEVTLTANAADTPVAPGAPKSAAQKQQDEAVMTSARLYAAEKLKEELVKRSAVTGRAVATLYFYPDGSPVRPIPADLSERDEITLKVLVAKADLGTGSLNVSACPDEVPFRLQGTFKEAAGFGQGALEIVEQDLGALRCGAGAVSFEVKGQQGATTTSLKLGEVYWGTFGVQFTFDFTEDGKLGTAKNAAGMSIITRGQDLLGPKVVPTFVWHPFGYDPHHPSVLGVLVNPSLGFDVDNMTTSFYVGDQICGAGLCLAAGAHIRKVPSLSKTSGLKVGDAFDPATGSLPVEDGWSSEHGGIGPFVGVTVDVNTAAKMLGGD